MTDINDIKNVIYFLPYLRTETWYVIGACIGVYAIHIFFLALAERHRKYRERMMLSGDVDDPYETARNELSKISLHDDSCFTQISLVVRTYLECSSRVPNAVKKTMEQIVQELPSNKLQILLETCSMYEYAPNRNANHSSKKTTLSLAQEIIEELHDTTG